MEELFNAIPAAASSPYALAAYAIAAVIFLLAGARLRVAKMLLEKIETIPPEERKRTVEIATGTILPTEISAEQWIRNNRTKWAFLLSVSVLVVILVIVVVALASPDDEEIKKLNSTVQDGNKQVMIDLWRNRYEIGEVTGYAAITIDLTEKSPPSGLKVWLNRVEEDYKALKSLGAQIERAWRGTGIKGDEYIEINALTSPKKNWSLVPNEQEEQFVHELLFNSRYILLATGGDKGGLLLSPFSFEAKATSVKIYFNSTTEKPIKIEGNAEGSGVFNPVPGQFSHWLDFYGAELKARQIILVNPLPEAFELVEYDTIKFSAKDDQWNKSATFATYTGAELYTDKKRSLIVMNADWKTLGKVPGDYPGNRADVYGPVPEPW